jgi:hypothetical protein
MPDAAIPNLTYFNPFGLFGFHSPQDANHDGPHWGIFKANCARRQAILEEVFNGVDVYRDAPILIPPPWQVYSPRPRREAIVKLNPNSVADGQVLWRCLGVFGTELEIGPPYAIQYPKDCHHLRPQLIFDLAEPIRYQNAHCHQ